MENWITIESVELWDDNPNQGDVGAIMEMIRHFGYRFPIGLRDGKLTKSGNHRIKALRELMKESRQNKPTSWTPFGPCIRVNDSGQWEIQYIDHSDLNEAQSTAFAIADNRAVRLGNDDMEKLSELLSEIKNDNTVSFSSTGYDLDDLEDILNDLLPSNHSLYTRKIDPPVYIPSDTQPPISELYKTDKMDYLLADISKADIPDELREFLRVAAIRHAVLNFDAIADYYAHTTPEIQRLMEDSALVIIDFNRAIENGFVNLSQRLAGLFDTDYPDG